MSTIIKIVSISFVLWIGYMIYTGDMGGSREATSNYSKILGR